MGDFFIKCDDASLISDKQQYKEASFWERLKLSFHLLMCKNCKVYTDQNALITEVLKVRSIDLKKVNKNLSKKEKEVMQKKIKENL